MAKSSFLGPPPPSLSPIQRGNGGATLKMGGKGARGIKSVKHGKKSRALLIVSWQMLLLGLLDRLVDPPITLVRTWDVRTGSAGSINGSPHLKL